MLSMGKGSVKLSNNLAIYYLHKSIFKGVTDFNHK